MNSVRHREVRRGAHRQVQKLRGLAVSTGRCIIGRRQAADRVSK